VFGIPILLHTGTPYQAITKQPVRAASSAGACWLVTMRCSVSQAPAAAIVCSQLLLPAQVLERIKDPLKTLISRDDPAVVYAVLSHLLLIVRRAPIIFENVSRMLMV
jgi:hypothetical protein